MTDMMTTAALIERIGAMDAEELDRLQAAIDRRRRHLAGGEVFPTAGTSSTVVERRAYGSWVLQLEKRGESGPYWYFHHRRDGKQKTVYFGKTEPTAWKFRLPKPPQGKGQPPAEGLQFAAEVLDTWNMTITPVAGTFTITKETDYFYADRNRRSIPLPGKPYMAIRIRRIGIATAPPGN